MRGTSGNTSPQTGIVNRTSPEPRSPGSGALVVARGVDTLRLGFRGRVRPSLREQLRDATEKARAREGSESPDKGAEARTPVVVDLAGLPWEVLPRAPWWAEARLACEGFGTLLVARPDLEKNPALAWEPACEALWSRGWSAAWEAGEGIARAAFGGEPAAALVSRVDLAADLVGTEWERTDPRSWSTRAKVTSAHGPQEGPEDCSGGWAEWVKGPRRETLRWGKGGIVVRAYDKTEELKASGKEWFRPLWERGGAAAADRVWRLEVQLRRPAAKRWEALDPRTGEALSPDTRAGFAACLPAWWGRVVGTPGSSAGAWLTLREPSANAERRRWPLDPTWPVVQGAFAGRDHDLIEALPQPVNLDQRVAQLAGLFTSYAAAYAELHDPDGSAVPGTWEVYADLMGRIERRHQDAGTSWGELVAIKRQAARAVARLG